MEENEKLEALTKQAEQLLDELKTESDASLVKLNAACGDKAIEAALLASFIAHRQLYAFSSSLCSATGKNVYRRGWDFVGKLTDSQRRQWLNLKSGASNPLAPLPAKFYEVLDEIRLARERVEKLARSTVAPAEEYESRSRVRTVPSVD